MLPCAIALARGPTAKAPVSLQTAEHSVAVEALELQESFAEYLRLQAADLELLPCRETGDMRAARHHVDLVDGLDVRQRAAPEADEPGGIKPGFEISLDR